jgi:pyruvate-formate lyase-activating enzyme
MPTNETSPASGHAGTHNPGSTLGFPVSASFGSGDSWDHSSCRYLESGLAFYSDKIAACGVIHHGTGMPELAAYSGGPIPFAEIASRRAELIRKNQIGCESPCKGCPNLVRKRWPKPSGRIDWIGITHFNGCNNACDYCWLQWGENGRGKPNHPSRSYAVADLIEEMAANGLIADSAVVDFGGGGEPTLMPEFDRLLVHFARSGSEQWVHTNGVRLPEPVRGGGIDLRKVRIVCSVDAGTPQTYHLVKARDHFRQVWENLAVYRDHGATVIAKYIMQENNGSEKDIEGFVRRARSERIPLLQWDIDLRFPDPSEAIIASLAYLHHLAEIEGLPLSPANIGLKSSNREGVLGRIAQAAGRLGTEAVASARFISIEEETEHEMFPVSAASWAPT